MTIDDIKDLLEKIEQSKTKKANLEGKIESLHQQLKLDFDIDNFDRVQDILDELEIEINDLEDKIKLGLDEIEKELNK